MAKNNNKHWKDIVDLFRHIDGAPPTIEELEKFNETDPITAAQIDAVVNSVVSKDTPESLPEFDDQVPWDTLELNTVEEGVLQLNRNKGEDDDAVSKRLKQLREEELGTKGENNAESKAE